ncbi:hypothetical protein AB0O34_30370 [Sphaerisporangium sp. NPDC088356]|uniref:hypothetical protein n=1 Tax=Sphaerisporangium sp. NPDC088356 TaxID=3154871 RepID=UPI003420EFFF
MVFSLIVVLIVWVVGVAVVGWAGAGDGQEGQGEHDGGDVPVPAGPCADLVLGQAEQVLAVLVVLLNPPPVMPL